MTRLLLVRHGETVWNAARRFQGVTDVPLSERGRAQAAALAGRLVGEPLHAILASDLRRAYDTAALIAERQPQGVTPEPRLREIGFGDWEGMTYAEIEQRDPDTLARWVADCWQVTPNGGEPFGAFIARVRALLEDLRARRDEETVLLVAHGGPLQVLLCLALGLEPRARWQFRLDPASLSELYLYQEGAILTLLNDQHHLKEVAT
ncbi:MAG: alpha-ribazole phosphatase [Chloroflexi bacterium]|jgi:alpha-ribazole phosphatase|nr:alpha-ribazole phosphatase [Chloroflexota bacterium]